MSRRETLDIKCPKCGHSQRTAVWHSLNASLDPEAKQALLQGEFHIFHCQQCDNKAFMDFGFIYHDMEKNFAIRYCPYSLLDDDNYLDEFTVNGEINLPELQGVTLSDHLRRPQIVFSMNEVIRYIEFRDKLYGRSKRRPPTADRADATKKNKSKWWPLGK